MKRSPGPSNESKTRIVLDVSAEDAERLQEAFAEGKLADRGITSISFPPELEAEFTRKQWTQSERRR